jgi:hypothetical protein
MIYRSTKTNEEQKKGTAFEIRYTQAKTNIKTSCM